MSSVSTFTERLKKASIAIGVAMVVQGCATNSATGGRIIAKSESWEIKTGQQYHPEILKQYTVYNDPKLQNYVDSIGQRLAKQSHRPDLDYTFTLLDSPQVNAFALPGGYIYITRGIMAYMTKEAHLAGVIGHEIGHVTGHHGAQRAQQQEAAGIASAIIAVGTGIGELGQVSQYLGGALISGYGRKQELQSDRLGAEYIAKNNYNVDDMIGVIGILKDQELFAAEKAKAEGKQVQGYHGLFSTHPKNDTRLKEAIKAAEKYRDLSKPVPDDGKFLRLTNGMAYGEAESQGITRGNKFYHKSLNLFIEFPQGWTIQNSAQSLAAISPQQDQAIVMQMESLQGAVNPSRYLASQFSSFQQGQQIQTADGTAYAGIGTKDGKQQRIAMLNRGNQAFFISGLGKSSLPNQTFFDVTKSVRKLRSNELALASGRKIKLVTAQRGDTIRSLAAKSNLDTYAEAQIRLINDLYPDGEPTPGQLIKIIQ